MSEPRPVDDALRLALARFVLSPELASALTPPARERALAVVLGPASERAGFDELVRRLTEFDVPEVRSLVARARTLACSWAVQAHEARSAGRPLPDDLAVRLTHLPLDVPLGWTPPAGPRLGEALSLLADRLFLAGRREDLPELRGHVAQALSSRLAGWGGPAAPAPLDAPGLLADLVLASGPPAALAAALREAQASLSRRTSCEATAHGWAVSEDASERRRLLDVLLGWPSADAAASIVASCGEPWAQERAAAVLSLRFGRPFGTDWARWRAWLLGQAPTSELDRLTAAGVDPAWLLLLQAMLPGSPLAGLESALAEWCASRAEPQLPARVLERWAGQMPALEAALLAGPAVTPDAEAPSALPALAPGAATEAPRPAARAEPEPPPILVVSSTPVATEPAQQVPVRPPSAAPETFHTLVVPPPAVAPPAVPRTPRPAPPPPQPPAQWRGFLAENANLLAGVVMLLAGASIVAYFTWDRHWLFRYTIVPGLFGVFTAGLAASARWLERNDPQLAGTAAMLRGAAIALLPANCMSVSLLADDPVVAPKAVVLPLMAALYFVLLTFGLRRWCTDVHPGLRTLLPPALLFLDALVLVRPLARSLARLDDLALTGVLAAGFYAGFAVVAATLARFAGSVLDRDLGRVARVAWFTGATLVVTYVQVFAWAHAWERLLPPAELYAPLVVMAGGLVFHVERRFRVVLSDERVTGEDSFVGFALVLAGVLAGFPNPHARIACFLLAGTMWLAQARFRANRLHDYLGLLLLALGGAGVAFVPGFPRPWAGALGLGLSIAIGGASLLASRLGAARVREAGWELQQALLVLTAVVAALAQRHFRSEPLSTAALLAVVAILHLRRARVGEAPRDVVLGAMVAAVALPYLGFADVRGQTLAGNTLAMGTAILSLLWLATIRVTGAAVMRAQRSTVLFLYGIVALGAMAARVALERQVPVSLSWAVAFPEYAGPFLMLGVLVAATLWSRSMLPVALGLVIVTALFPAVKADFRVLFPALSWGSGYGSATAALILLVVAFHVRGLRSLRELGPGDRLFGEAPFPLVRHDASLLTTPVVATVLFLTARVDTWSLLRNLEAGPSLKTSAAIIVTAVVWTLLGVWAREHAAGPVGVRLGFATLLLGLGLGQRMWGDPGAFEGPALLAGLVLQAAEIGYRAWLVPRHPWAEGFLVAPTQRFLERAGVVAGAVLVVVLLAGHEASSLRLLLAFTALQLVRGSLARGGSGRGGLLWVGALVALLAETAPGSGALLGRLTWESSLGPVLGFVSVLLVALAALDRAAWRERAAPLAAPARALVFTILAGLAPTCIAMGAATARVGPWQEVVLVVDLLLLARWALPGPALLAAALLAYLRVLHAPLAAAGDLDARLRVVADPPALALFALALALATARAGWVARLSWLRCEAALPALATRVTPWLRMPAALAAVVATTRHSLFSELRDTAPEAIAPYVAAFALVVLGVSVASRAVAALGVVALTLGNVHVVRFALGDLLRGHGLAEAHLLALGVAATLAQATIARRVGPAAGRSLLRQVELSAAALMLALLCGNFAVDPSLQDITEWRFVASGTLAAAAGLYFRRAAKQPEPDEVPYVDFAWVVYHAGVAMALWCLVLLLPFFRRPEMALVGLALPFAWFYGAAERFRHAGDARDVRYARSAASTGTVVIALYALRPFFQATLFPDGVVRTDHYHQNALLVLLLGLALVRLHAFLTRSAFAMAFLGGAAVMAGAYFAATGVAGIGPFATRFPAAWAGVALAHTLAALLRSAAPRAWAERLARVGDEAWARLSLVWRLTAALGVAELAFVAVVHPDAARYGWGALLGGAASLALARSVTIDRLARVATAVTALLLSIGLVEAASVPSLLSTVGVLAVALGGLRVAPGPFALVGFGAAYVLAHHGRLVVLADEAGRWALLGSPWRVATLALAMSLAVEAARRMRPQGADAGGPLASLRGWLGLPAAALALVAAGQNAMAPGPPQLQSAYLATAVHLVLALSPELAWLAWPASALLAVGNLHVVQRQAGDWLRLHGMTFAHETAIATAAMLALAGLSRLAALSDPAVARRSRIRGAGGAVVVVLLLVDYAVAPGLASVSSFRASIIVALAIVAAEGLRELARRTRRADVEAAYHLAAAVGLWALALVVPVLRRPEATLLVLALPALYFWVRVEVGGPLGDPRVARYRASALAASALVLACYASRALFQWALAPEALPVTRHYHTHAAVALLVGILLLRLHALGAPNGAATVGGLAALAGSYFGLTALPGLSPFAAPLAGAWVGIAYVHLATLATAPASAVTSFIRAFGGLEQERWDRLRGTLEVAALLGAHVLALAAIGDPQLDGRAVAPLLCGTASLLAHHGVLRRSGAYFDLAGIELLLAFHADLVVPSHLALDDVVWVLLALRALALAPGARSLAEGVRGRVEGWGTVCATLTVAHVFHHRPWTPDGLAAAAILATLTALAPRTTETASSLAERCVAALLVATPTWLVHFATAPWQQRGVRALIATESYLLTLAAVLATGIAARSVDLWGGAGPAARPRALHQVRSFLQASGARLYGLALHAVSAGVLVLLVGHYDLAYAPAELGLFAALLAGLAVAWYRLGVERSAWTACLVGEGFAAATFALVRRQLLLTTPFWTYENDLWVSLAVSALATGVKQRLQGADTAVQRPLTLSILAMPAFAIGWAVAHDLGSDMVLLVVGLNTLLFAFLGHDRRDSPWNLVAVSGFVAFVVVVFWTRLELRVIHAYVVPVGIGVLLLLQLFEHDVPPAARSRIRLATLVAMLASAGWHALLDGRHPLAFNLTLLVLCLLCMAVGSFLRVRLYVGLGLGVLLLDLASLATKALSRMESQARMTWVGVAIFMLGATVVAMAVLHKARGAGIEERLARLARDRFGGWQ